MKYKKIKKKIKESMDKIRYQHTKGVVKTAKHLAKIYGADVEQVCLAALLHDCAKYMSDKEKFSLCKLYEAEVTPAEKKNPSLLHAKCGAILARSAYNVKDPAVLHAITVHTTGVPNMNLLDKIIFVADYIEPGRDQAPNLDELRELADTDLDRTVYRILKDTVEYLNNRKDQVMDPTTCEAYHYYADLYKDEEREKDE